MRSKKAIYNIITNLLLQIIVIIYGFIVPKIIISKFGSNVNGLISSIAQFLGYISLLEAGFGPVVKSILYRPIASKDKKTIRNILKTSEKFFRNIAMIFLVYIFILSCAYPLLANNDFSFWYTFSLVIIVSISTFSMYFFGMTYRLYLQSEQKTYVISIIQIVTYIISAILIIIMAKLNVSVHIIKLISGIVFIFRPIILNIYVKKKYDINLRDAEDNYEIKQKWDGLAQHVAAVVRENTDITILTFLRNLFEVSVYSVYRMIVMGVRQIMEAFINGIDSFFGDMLAKKEQDNLNKKFEMYEIIYFSLATILFASTMSLITPFVSIYTKGVTDTNYIRYLFGYLIVISEYIYILRLPYHYLIVSIGHFKETKKGAWIEALSNIIISIILVKKYGLVGIMVGSIFAVTIRTCEFIYYVNKYILKRNIIVNMKKILLLIIEFILIFIICRYLPLIENSNYINWIINAILVTITATIITLSVNFAFYKKEFKEIFIMLRNIKNERKSKIC